MSWVMARVSVITKIFSLRSCSVAGSKLGILMGMTFPLLTIPTTLVGSLGMALIPKLTVLQKQESELQAIRVSQIQNTEQMENLYNLNTLDIQQIEFHRQYGVKLTVDEKNKERIIENTKALLARKQKEVQEAHKKVEVLKNLKEKQEKQYYKDFLDSEIKEIDDITSARFNR